MPANHGLRGDKDQRSLPAGPNFSQNDPEQPVDGTQSRTRSLWVQSRQLLPKGEVLEQEFSPGAKGGDQPSRADVGGAQTLGDHSEGRAAQVRLEVIDCADVQSFGEAQAHPGASSCIGLRTQRVSNRAHCTTTQQRHGIPKPTDTRTDTAFRNWAFGIAYYLAIFQHLSDGSPEPARFGVERRLP
jgi:hypothetical protein